MPTKSTGGRGKSTALIRFTFATGLDERCVCSQLRDDGGVLDET